MDPDVSALDAALENADLDGYVLDAASDLSNQRYLSGFDAGDPFLSLYVDGRIALLVSNLEYQRAKTESRADVVRRMSDYDYLETVESQGRREARLKVTNAFLREFDVESVACNLRFPLFTADGLRDRGVRVEVDTADTIEEIRSVKLPEEIAEIREVQEATEAAMAVAEELIFDATLGDDGRLMQNGEPLTSEFLRARIERELLDWGVAPAETIVASGTDSAVPHERGSGPIRTEEPIILDIFPRSKASHYHADMTRTFVHGTPDSQILDFHETTREAKAAGIAAVEPGVTGRDVHDAVCEVYEDAGYPTLRTDEETETGFLHSTGHGVGLDVHEQPRLASDGDELEEGHVVTIEPGLYDPSIGGVRIEDLVLVTEDGAENLTSYHESLSP